MSYEVVRIKSVPTTVLGEGPFWDVPSQSLYFVDSALCTIHCYSFNDDRVYSASIDKTDEKDIIGFIIPVKGKPNHFAIGLGIQIVEIEWDSRSPTYKFMEVKFLPEGKKESKNRVNDAKADSKHRLYFGSMPRHIDLVSPREQFRTANFYYKAKDGPLVHVRDKVGISNGITWNRDQTKLYYVDTINEGIDQFDYDKETGKLSNPQRLYNVNQLGFINPDGMTSDVNDNLYVAVFDGNRILRIDSRMKQLKMEIIISDMTNVTSCAFGGPNMNILFVTSGSFLMDENSEHFKNAGGLYKVIFTDQTIKGREMHKVEL